MFLDAWYDRERRRVRVAVAENGELRVVDHPPPVDVALYDRFGDGRAFDGSRATLRTFASRRYASAWLERRRGARTWNPRFDPALRVLRLHYASAPPPEPVRAFLDIEVDTEDERGFARPEDPFAPIIAVTVHMRGRSTMIALRPPGRDCGTRGDLVVVPDEHTLLAALCDTVFPEIHVWCGWNSAGYDLPYIVRRLRRIGMGSKVRALCAGGEEPVPKPIDRFGTRTEVFETRGRVHLDYLDLYRRFVRRELHSYALDHVAQTETGRRKVPYSGTIGRMWREDFDRFVAYGITDVDLLVSIEDRRRILDLALTMAWSSLVPLRMVTGTVRMVEQAILGETTRRGYVPPPPGWKRPLGDDFEAEEMPVAGAAVLEPKRGLHRWVSSVDVSSLYPSVIRSLNISPETLVGQLEITRTRRLVKSRLAAGLGAAEAWSGLYGTVEYRLVCDRSEEPLTLYCAEFPPWLPGGAWTAPAREIAEILLDPEVPLALAGSGAVFRTDVEGILPGLLAGWYERRKREREAAALWRRLASEGIPLRGEDR